MKVMKVCIFPYQLKLYLHVNEKLFSISIQSSIICSAIIVIYCNIFIMYVGNGLFLYSVPQLYVIVIIRKISDHLMTISF